MRHPAENLSQTRRERANEIAENQVKANAGLAAETVMTRVVVPPKRLGVQRAMVLGQILPGIPIWEFGAEMKFPGLPYVVFHGNVGWCGADSCWKITFM